MNVKLKTKVLKSSKLSYYLQYYDPETRKRSKEYLGLYLFDKPKDELERKHNKETKELANKVQAKKLIEFQSGRFGFKQKPTHDITLYAYYEKIRDSKWKDSSTSNYDKLNTSFKHLKKFTRKDVSLLKIDYQFLMEYRSYLLNQKIHRKGSKLNQNSAHTYFNHILFILKEAYKEGLIPEDTGKRVKQIPRKETKREFLTEEEIQSLFNTPCKDARIKASFLFGTLTGLRFSDIEKLEWKEVQYSKSQGWFIRFEQKKTNGQETLHISDQARELLGDKTKDNQRVFKGLKYSASNNDILHQWIKDSGITKHITFHSSRHTHAYLLLSKGVDIYTVSKILGHKDLKTTEIYAKIADQRKKDAVER
ncbi:MAG: site-specific integrase, partial [Cyclobacteriaceae bacterium]|nr:site-specific integrase [Cyclobacteriaceae bacterium]